MEPVDRATIWPYDERGEPRQFYYSRYGSPTVAEAEERLGELDGGRALLFPSGSGAATTLVLSMLQPGDTIALAEGCYFGTGVTFQTLAGWGLRYLECDQPGAPVVRSDGIAGLIAFDVHEGEAARRVETSTRLTVNATKLGGVESVMESRHRSEGERVPTGLLRLSVELEDADALWDKLAGA